MKRHLISKVAMLGILPFLLAACSQQENELIKSEVKQVPLEISLATDTRAIIDGITLPDASNFGIFGITEETGELQNDIYNISVAYDKKECFLSRDVFLDERPTTIYAYYPFNEKATLNSVPVQVNNGSYDDYLYGRSYDLTMGTYATVNNEQPHATIYFKHAMALIRLFVYKTADYEGDAIVSGFVVNGVPLQGTLDVITGQIKTTEYGDMVYTVEASPLYVEGEGTTVYRFLTIPTDMNLDRGMLMELDGKYVVVPLPYTIWKMGQQYTYTVVVDRNQNALVTKGEIIPWENNTLGGITVDDDNYIQ